MKRTTDFSPYKNILPYDSEVFGVYQPIIGWRGARTKRRISKGFQNDRDRIFDSIYKRFRADFRLKVDDGYRIPEIESIDLGTLPEISMRRSDSYLVESVLSKLPPLAEYQDEIWVELLSPQSLRSTLNTSVKPKVDEWYKRQNPSFRGEVSHRIAAYQFGYESKVAGYLSYLAENKHFHKLKKMFYKQDERLRLALQYLSFQDPLDVFDPHKDIDRVSLSPLGIVHLFRQYFFEFDTFLGTPVSHVWLSPGASVELIEIQTRKVITEKSFEREFESITKTEKSTTEQDELSTAVKESNKSDTKFGMNATVNQSWISGSASASSNISIGKTQDKAREEAHKQMKQQTEKLSTEIRNNYKSTFKTITEITDTSSKRYLLANSTEELINYELRRKMRQVGIQVQDIGTYLCWQTYVDDPGKNLGVGTLVHIAKSPELGNIPPPEAEPMPEHIETPMSIDIPFIQTSEDRGDLDEGYRNGREVDTDLNENDIETIRDDFGPFEAICGQAGYEFSNIEIDLGGNDVEIRIDNIDKKAAGRVTFDVHLVYVNFRGNSPIRIAAKITWKPTDATVSAITTENQKKIADFNEKTKTETEKSFVEAARERIKLASNIEPRSFRDLREEERIVVYRHLVQEMLTKYISFPDDRTRHVVAELLNTIFDIDKMLYFVAPEWWRPRLHQSHQLFGGDEESGTTGTSGKSLRQSARNAKAAQLSTHGVEPEAAEDDDEDVLERDTQISSTHVVSWGGAGEGREDNYFITEDSMPAKFGSSLGWLLQLDGDRMRNAFLNASWVKAVIPIRPGKEKAAMNWLERVDVEGAEGLDDEYVAPAGELAQIPHNGPKVTIRDAIKHLAEQVSQKHKDSLEIDKYPTEEINDDNKVSATPVDKVYEHGFYPLEGGFKAQSGDERFEVFDQWIEILPTDQVVPVEVKYDPKTGRQI